ncbi:MAG: DMT family transporter [Melioribacteraceae bacterium]
MDRQKKSLIFTLIAVLLWSTAATAFKLTLAGMNNVQLLFYSSLISTIALFIIINIKHPNDLKLCFQSKFIKNNLLLGFINPFLYYLVLFKAYSLIPAQEAMPLNYTWPIVIGIFSAIFLKQKLTTKTIVGMFIAFFGVFVIATRGDLFSFKLHNILGVSLALVSSIIWASFWIMNLIDKRLDSIKLFSAFFFGTIIILIYVILFDSFHLQNSYYLFGATYIGLFEMGITFFFWMTGLQLSKNKAKTSTIAYLSPFISMVFISIVLGEKLFPSSIVGLLFIVGGILFQHILIEKGKIKFNFE